MSCQEPNGTGSQPTLESWKEIAAYLQRDAKTARRWEKEEGLPVRRHSHNARSSVYAYPSELDTWRASIALSPDGRLLAIARPDPDSTVHISRIAVEGSGFRELRCQRRPNTGTSIAWTTAGILSAEELAGNKWQILRIPAGRRRFCGHWIDH